MKLIPLAIPGLLLIEPRRIEDERGFFSETFRADVFEAAVGPVRFVQDNHSFSRAKGTVRGLHGQMSPRAQGKLVRVGRGAILDVAVDVRPGSLSYGRHEAVELSSANWRQLWIPPGFLHGFCTLTDDAEVIYKVTDLYDRDCEVAVRWDDPALAISWPVNPQEAVLSQKDRAAPWLQDVAARLRAEG